MRSTSGGQGHAGTAYVPPVILPCPCGSAFWRNLSCPHIHARTRLAAQMFEGRLVEGDLKSGGHVLSATSGSGPNRQTYNYSTDRVVGNGSFGVVFQATCLETGETVGWCRARGSHTCTSAAQAHACTAAVPGPASRPALP